MSSSGSVDSACSTMCGGAWFPDCAREELTTDLVGHNRDVERADALRLGHNLLLVHAHQWRRIGMDVAAAITVMLSSVWDATWPIDSPVTRARARAVSCNPFGNPQHQTARRSRHAGRGVQPPQSGAEVHAKGTGATCRAHLIPCQHAGQFAHLVLDRAATETDSCGSARGRPNNHA